jgi:peptidoglycan/LPS O-acetylase OafA/YrhL
LLGHSLALSVKQRSGNLAASATRQDLPLLDALRLCASLAVVHHHLRGGYFFGVAFGVPLFLVIMLALGARGSARESLAQHARRKAAYLLVPWVRWSLVYVVLAVAVALARGEDPTAGLEPRMILYGGHGALWFLPFAMLALLVVRGARPALPRSAESTLLLAVLGGCSTWAAQRSLPVLAPDMPFDAWLTVSPAIFFGLAVARASQAESTRERAVLLALVAAGALVPSLVSPATGMMQDATRRFALAVPLACLGFGWRARVPRLVRELATLAFGVYLAHPLIAKALATATDVFAWPAAAHLASVWGASALLVLGLRRAPFHLAECWSGRSARVTRLPTPTEDEQRRAA